MNSLFNLNQHFPLLLDNDHLVEAINIPFAGRRCGKKVENRVKMQMSNIFGEGASVGDPPTEHITYNQQDPFDLPPKNKKKIKTDQGQRSPGLRFEVMAPFSPPDFLPVFYFLFSDHCGEVQNGEIARRRRRAVVQNGLRDAPGVEHVICEEFVR